jgi:hypothetical protein
MDDLVTEKTTEPTLNIKKLKPEYIWFNENPIRKKILEMVLKGDSIQEIMKELNIKEQTIIYTINHPHFINKLNKKLQVLYTVLVADKLRIQSDLLHLLYGTLTKTTPLSKRVKMTDEKIVKEIVNITKTETNKINISKVEKNPTFIFNNNNGKNRQISEEKKAENERELLKDFGIIEAEVEKDEQ